MKREFLKGLLKGKVEDGDISEIIDKIMEENGTDITDAKRAGEEAKKLLKGEITELEGKIEGLEKRADVTPEKLKEITDGLTEAQKQLKAFEGVDVADLQKRASDAEAKLTTIEEDHAKALAEKDADAQLQIQFATLNFSSEYAKKGVYDELRSKVKFEDGKVVGFDEALAELKESQPTAFVTATGGEPPKKDEGKSHKGSGTLPAPKDLKGALKDKYNTKP